MATSPYRAALGDAFDALHPRLKAYFDGIPEGGRGFGRGVFDTVGTPRRWLWPALWLLTRSHVVFLLGRARIPVPRPFAPRVVLSERYDDEVDAQRVSITLVLPVVGRLYEYAGTFRYEIEQGERTA